VHPHVTGFADATAPAARAPAHAAGRDGTPAGTQELADSLWVARIARPRMSGPAAGTKGPACQNREDLSCLEGIEAPRLPGDLPRRNRPRSRKRLGRPGTPSGAPDRLWSVIQGDKRTDPAGRFGDLHRSHPMTGSGRPRTTALAASATKRIRAVVGTSSEVPGPHGSNRAGPLTCVDLRFLRLGPGGVGCLFQSFRADGWRFDGPRLDA
jgi:hypothetical protein